MVFYYVVLDVCVRNKKRKTILVSTSATVHINC